MPTLADIQVATPRCGYIANRTFAGLSSPPATQCLAILSYLHHLNAWHCTACNRMHEGQRISKRLALVD